MRVSFSVQVHRSSALPLIIVTVNLLQNHYAPLSGTKAFLYDAGYKNEIHGNSLKKALKELIEKQSLTMVGAVFFHSQPGLEYLIREGVIRETNVIVSANIDPSACLKTVACKELSRLPLDDLSGFVDNKEFFDGLTLRFHFNRKYPLVRYCISRGEEAVQMMSGGDQQMVSNGDTDKQLASSDTGVDMSDGAKNNIVMYIKPTSLSTSNCSSVLVTGDTALTQIVKIDNIGDCCLSVFVVPHQESKECLSLLPEDTRKQLSNPVSLANASLHLALYHMRKSFHASVERLKGKKLEEKGKAFLDYYLNHFKPETDLETMLKDPEAKVSSFFHSENFQPNWYKEHKRVVFSELMKAVSEEEGKQQRRIALLQNSLAWAHFYRHIHAELYVISAKDLGQEPHLEILNGIIIASLWRKKKCCIVITDSLPCSLDDLIQRDVRKLAFPDGNSEPSVRVGFLDKSSPKIARAVPFFTINPWAQAQHHMSQHDTVSVDSCRHLVSGLGDEHPMHLIKDELDIKEGISTKNSSTIISHLSYSHRPVPSLSKPHFRESSCLVPYLKSIGHKISDTYTLDVVLGCLIGPSLVHQLRDIASKDIPAMMGIVPVLLKQKTSGNSRFTLTPTKSSASEADIDVYIPLGRSLQIGDKTIQNPTFIVKKARTMSVDITLKANVNSEHVSFVISKYLDLNGSCGKTVADHIYTTCCKEDAWFPARSLTVGEVLHIFLHDERALMAIQSLPLFLSFPLSKCKIKHYLTTVLVDSSQDMQEAHIHVNPFELPPVFVNKCELSVKIKSLAMHIFPLRDIDQHMIQIEGDCTVNRMPMKFTCSSTADSQKHVKLFFDNILPAMETFELFGISVPPTSLSNPIISGANFNNKLAYEGGFVLSQLLRNTEEASFTSLFFGAEFSSDIEHLLPPSLSQIQHTKMKTVVHFPSSTTPKLGLEASFTSTVGAEIELECWLSVCPSITDGSYTYDVTVRHCECEDITGMSVYAIISALNGTLGKNLKDEISKMSKLGDQILNSVSLRKIILQLMNREIQVIELHATMSELDIIPGKLCVNQCTLKISYSKEDLKVECSGKLVFLRHYEYSVHFSLPTANKKGEISFRSYNNDLIFKDVMQEFGWLTCDVKSNPILTKTLDVAVRRVALDFNFTPELQITASDIRIFKEKLDISVVTLRDIELDVSTKLVNGHYVATFSLGAYISDDLHAQLRFDHNSHILTGKVSVTFSKSVSAVDVLQIFTASTTSYKNMQGIVQEEFMDIFKSDLRIVTQPGLTASLSVSIGLPSKCYRQYALEHLNLEVEDALKICCCKDSYILNTLQFEYFNKSHDKDVASTSHLSLAVHQLNSKDNMTLNFDFTSKQDNTSFFTANVEAGPGGGFLKLSSVIDLACAAVPELPKFNVGLPPILDIELVSGSVTFMLRPTFQPSAFDINILLDEWRVFDDPKLTIHKITLKTTWKSGSYPQLTFTDCSLTFSGHKFNLSGKLTSHEVYIECRSAEKLPETDPTHFKSILEDYTPTSQLQPVLPTNIGLPPMEVELRELIIELKETKRKFRINSRVVACMPWMIKFGSHTISVHELGGALEWEKQEKETRYKAFLFGTIELFEMHVDMELLLGKNIDSIVSATISHPQCLHYGQVVDHLLCSEASHDYNPKNSGLSELVPSTMQDISLTSASAALNVTKKHFFLSSRVKGWGTGSLLIGYLVKSDEMDYVISLSLDEGFAFGRLSESIAFIDKLVQLKSLNVLISSTDLQKLSCLTNQFCSLSRSQVKEQKPFYESKILSGTKLSEFGIQAGTTIYAEINIARSKGGINKLVELGDPSLKSDITIMAYIGTAMTTQDLKIHAWIPKIRLFKILEFSDIVLMYNVQTASEFELSGTVALNLKINDSNPLLKFQGKLLVCPTFARFSTNSCGDLVSRPCNINVKVDELKLALTMFFNGESPDVFVSGSLWIGCIALTCKIFLKGITFKVFLIHLKCGLTLTTLFTCSGVDWPIQLDIGITKGLFYYAASNITFEEDTTPFSYEVGYHLEAEITLFNSPFRIKADISSDRSNVVLSGRSIEPIDFFFAKITGARPYIHEGPELKYNGSEKSLTLVIGVEILKHPCFEGQLKYKYEDKSLEGIIKYPGKFLWINEPSMTVRWSKDDGFNIIDFELFGDVPGFSLLGAIAKFAKIIYNIVSGILRWSVKLHLKTGKNPNTKKHLVNLVLFGEFIITVIGFDIPVLPLPEVPILLPRMDDFSFAKLPQYILKCLWNSAGPICMSLLSYLNPWNLLCKSAQLIYGGIKGALDTVVNVTKKICHGVVDAGRAVVSAVKNVGKKCWRGICSFFGCSAFIVDLDNGMVLGYIRGGKGGHDLCDEKYIVEQFGPILTVHAIGAMAHDVHKHLKSCVDAQDNERAKSCDEVDDKERTLDERNKAGLDELKGKAEKLAENVNIEAENVLTVKEVCIKIDDDGKNISVEWSVYNPEEDTFYNEDKGDIEYHTKITATVIEGENVKTVSIYDEVFINKDTKEVSNEHVTEQDQLQITEATQLDTPQIAEASSSDQNGTEIEAKTSNDKMIQDTSNSQNASETSLSPTAGTLQGDEVQFVEEKDLAIQKHIDSPDKLPTRISFKVPFDPKTLEHTLCICASIQPRVTLEVKMLPPDKIATEEHMIDKQRLEEGDTLWMDDAKREIEENGRVNEVTLEGKKMCVQQLLKPDSDTKVQFTAQCFHQEDSLTVSGDITQVPDTELYLVRIVDASDLTVIIKQCQLFPPKLHYRMEAFLSDFPQTSLGPYHISIIALNTDLSTCSVFTDSELKITRYGSPICLTETLPNLDSSNSDIVRLEWNHSKSSEYKGTLGLEDVPVTDSQEEENASEEVQAESACSNGQDGSDKLTNVPVKSKPRDDDQSTPPTESIASEVGNKVSQNSDRFYTVSITGVCIKRPRESTKHEAVSIDNIDSNEEVFKISVPVRWDQDSQEESVGYNFSLDGILKKTKHELQGGLLFQCQVVTNGVSRLHSMPRSFADFILLAPPMDLKVTTPVRRPGLCIGWEYSAHAIGYRIELVDEHTTENALSKVLKCETGSRGEAILYKNDFKNIPYTRSTSKGYRLQMYSLGFGQELIRCLNPSVAEGMFHVIPAELQYFIDSNIVRVKFRTLTKVKAEYVVELCRVTEDDEPLHLTARYIYDHEVHDETVIDFPLKKLWHKLQSGDLLVAWVCSTATQDCSITYIGVPQEEVCVIDSPKLKVSLNYHSDGTMSGMKLAWSDVVKAQSYQYGYYLSDKKESIALMNTQEREAIINFESSALEQLACGSSCQFQVYVTALGKPGMFVTGEYSLDANRLQCIVSRSLEEHGVVVFTSISLQQVWGKHLADHVFSHYYVPLVINSQHVLFPNGIPFPYLNIPHSFMERFWKMEFPFFRKNGNLDHYTREGISLSMSIGFRLLVCT